MSSRTLIAASGATLCLAAVLQFAGWLIHPRGEQLTDLTSAAQVPSHALMLLSWTLVLLALPGAYARHASRAGKLWLLAYALTMLAAVFHLYLVGFEVLVAPVLAERDGAVALIEPGGALAHGGGTLNAIGMPLLLAFPLFGVASLRARVFPHGAGWLQIAALPLFLAAALVVSPDDRAVPGALSAIALLYYAVFVGYAWIGYALWTEPGRRAEPAPALPAVQPSV